VKLRRLALGLACGLAATLAMDLALGRFALSDGEWAGRPVPPYGDMGEARFRLQAEIRLKALAQGAEPTRVLAHDADLGWTNAPGFRSPDGRQCFNSKGLRGTKEHAPRPAPGVLRVALFGESFVYGEEVSDGEEFGSALEALDPGIEVLNFGVSGFGTDQALLRLRRDGRESAAEVVCLGVMLENIGRNLSRFTRLRNPYIKGLGIKPRFLLDQDAPPAERLVLIASPFATEVSLWESVLAGTLPERVREHDPFAERPYDDLLWKSSFYRLWTGWRGSAARDYRTMWRAEGSPAYSLLLALAEAFDVEARAAGARHTLVLLFPPREDLAHLVGGGAPFWDRFARDLAARHIPCLDLAPALAARARELSVPGDDATRTAYRVFLRAHLNAEGNAAVARALRDRLRAL
jgi:hypothetical protein